MPRIGVLGLEPFLVNQIDQLDRRSRAIVMDPLGDEDRAALELDVVVVSRDHAAAPRLVDGHPNPPVVVVDDGDTGDEPVDRDAPRRLQRPVASPQLRDAIDRSLGVPAWRRGLRAITTQQDDAAVPDRLFAVTRTLAALATLWFGVLNLDVIGIVPLVLFTGWLLARTLWWRLTPALVAVDVFALTLALVGAGVLGTVPPLTLALLAALIAAEGGFLWGWWPTAVGALVLTGVQLALWSVLLDRRLEVMADGASTVLLLVLTAAAAGSMGKRLWLDRTRSRTSELRRFRAALYELSRRQAVVAVSFDLGTVAEDALSRLLADVHPRAAMVLVADGPGPLQVAASHNLATPPPVRLTWQPGLDDGHRSSATGPGARAFPDTAIDAAGDHARPPGAGDPDTAERTTEQVPDWRPTRHQSPDPSTPTPGHGDGGTAPPADIDPGATAGPLARSLAMRQAQQDALVHAPEPTGSDDSVIDPSSEARPAPDDVDDDGADDVDAEDAGDLATRLAAWARSRSREADEQEVPDEVGDEGDEPPATTNGTADVPAPIVERPGQTPSPDHAADVGASPPVGEPTDVPEDPPAGAVDDDAVDVAAPDFDPDAPLVGLGPDRAPPSALDIARALEWRRTGPGLIARSTIRGSHGSRLREVLGQLGQSLPDGAVLVQACELDGELMGALVVVEGSDDAPVARQAEEAALALDSVRLFNRLRAFTRDQERARIGRSLHDGVMQTLAHVAFELDRVADESWDEAQVETLGRMRDHVLGTVDEMRAVVNDLRTVRLDRGLPAALEAMALTLSPAGGPVIEVQAEEIGPQPGDVEEQFLRIAEEALNNAVQHSGARRVLVRLEIQDGAVLLQVLDDGFGFSGARRTDTEGGVGLTSMYQRARAIDAGLDIDTGANGTIVTLHHTGRASTSTYQDWEFDEDARSHHPDAPRRWWRRG